MRGWASLGEVILVVVKVDKNMTKAPPFRAGLVAPAIQGRSRTVASTYCNVPAFKGRDQCAGPLEGRSFTTVVVVIVDIVNTCRIAVKNDTPAAWIYLAAMRSIFRLTGTSVSWSLYASEM